MKQERTKEYTKMINITQRNDHVLTLRASRWNEPVAISQSEGVTVMVIAPWGERIELERIVSTQEEGTLEIEWPSNLRPSVYGMEICGVLASEGQWFARGDKVVKVTHETERDAEEVTLPADSYDITLTIGVRRGQTGVIEELRQTIAGMIEEEFNASETRRVEAEIERARAEGERVEAENERVASETAREAAETGRSKAEDERRNAETLRQYAENQRSASFSSAQQGRTAAFSEQIDDFEERYVAAEQSRDTHYSEAETGRNSAYEQAETSRDSAFTSSQQKRAAYFLEAETQRQTTFNNAEQTRQNNETQRRQEENRRVAEETLRKISEQERSSQESTRQSNEQTRQINETQRRQEENRRVDEETLRKNSEQERSSQESTRQSNEQTRQNNETQRQQAETLRQSAYDSAETQRNSSYETAEQSRNSNFALSEHTRDERYTAAEENRNDEYDDSETARDTRYAAAEGSREGSLAGDNSRWGQFKEAEKARDLLVDVMLGTAQWAGCRWRKDSVTPEGEPCGSLQKLARLPELIGLGGYLVLNDHTRKKLSAADHQLFATGGAASLAGDMGHYQWGWNVTLFYAHWEDDTYEYEAVDIKPIPGRLNYVIPPGSRSCAGYATRDRVDGNLVSFVNFDIRYRGGNNNASLDGLFNSQLCKPATNISITSFASAARLNGNMWLANSRVMFFMTAALKRIIFHNRHIQAGLNGTLTADGLHQGGTGNGAGTPSSWSGDWKYYPYIPLDAGVSMGDYTGVFSVEIDDNGVQKTIGGIPSFFGLKNDYKYMWCMCEDIILRCNEDKSQSVFILNEIDGSTFNLTTVEGKVLLGATPCREPAGWGYISKENLDHLTMFPLQVGASGSTGYADGYYNPAATSGLRGACCLGFANDGDYAGSAFLYGYYAPSVAIAFGAACLCEFERPFSTVPTMYA